MFLANLLIALREGLEAALVVSIIVAYLVKADRRDALPKLWLGVGLAALIPLVAGAIMTWGPKTLTFQAQEILGGTLSFVAVGMVTWMIFWMGKNARELKGELEGSLSKSLSAGSSGWGVVWIAVVAVGREGVETALFVWATVRSSIESSTMQTTAGVVTGLALAIVLGVLIYQGAVRINFRIFFAVTGYFLVVVAAGIVAYGVGDLQEANVLPGFTNHAWDLSRYLPDGASPFHWLYVLLQAMFQFNLQPTVLQVVGWWVYIVPTLVLLTLQITGRWSSPARAVEATPAAASADESDAELKGHHTQPLLPQQQERHEDEDGEELEGVGDREPQQEPAQPATQVGAQPQQDEDDHDDVVLDDDEDRDEQRHRGQEVEGDPLAALPADAEVTRDIHQHLSGEKRGQHHHGLEPQLRRRRQQVLEAGDPVDDVGRQVPQPEEQVERNVIDRRVSGRGVLDRDPVEVADPPLKNRVQEVEGVLEGGSHVPVEEEGVGAEQDDAQQRPVHEAGTLGTAPPGAEAAVHHALDHPASLIAHRLSERAHPCGEAGGGAGLRRGVVIGFLGVVVLDLTRSVLRGLTGHESLPVHRGGGQWSPRRRRRDAPGGLCGR